MNYILAFIFSGLVCAIGQVILDNTKLTPGHITSLFTAVGAFLSFMGWYDILINKFGAGATVIIANFGHMLYSSALQGYIDEEILGIFSGMFIKSSIALTSVIVFSFICSFIFKAKD